VKLQIATISWESVRRAACHYS